MNNRVLEYIIRAVDRTRDGTQSASRNAEQMARSAERSSRVSGEAFTGLAAKAGLVVMAFKVGWDIGKRINEWISPTQRLAAAWEKVSEQVERSKKFIAEQIKESKERIEQRDDVFKRDEKRISTAADFKAGMANAGKTSMSAEEAQIRKAEADSLKAVADRRVEALNKELADARMEQTRARLSAVELGARPSAPGGYDTKADKEWDTKRDNIVTAEKLADDKIALIEAELAKASDAAADAGNAVTLAAVVSAAAAGRSAAETAKANEAEQRAADAAAKKRADETARSALEAQKDAERAAEKEARLKRDLEAENARAAHQARLANIREQIAVEAENRSAALDRLSRATSAAQQAWGWYRDPEAFKKQLQEEKDNADAEESFKKDFESLKERQKYEGEDWRTAELSDDYESVRRVALAREEEDKAKKSLEEISANTKDLAKKLDEIMRVRQ